MVILTTTISGVRRAALSKSADNQIVLDPSTCSHVEEKEAGYPALYLTTCISYTLIMGLNQGSKFQYHVLYIVIYYPTLRRPASLPFIVILNWSKGFYRLGIVRRIVVLFPQSNEMKACFYNLAHVQVKCIITY